ncbi:MAG: tetratricopeptide repeat protein, partial [Kiritimatiellae bacterium]|nr:tetratricopeptide repeat protein [Kiritimatiellia bacterium]
VGAFEAVLLLLCARFFLSYALHGQSHYAVLLALACGVGIVESPTIIVFAPLFGISLLFAMWHHNSLRVVPLLKPIIAAVVGLSTYLLAAWWYYHTEGYQLYNYSGFWQIIWSTWREQYHVLLRNLPKTGWLLVGLTTAVPWLISLLVARRALNEEKDWTYYILHVAITLVAFGVLFNIRFAPWPLFGFSRLLVTPYILAAGLYGYLAAYWFLLFSGGHREEESQRRVRVGWTAAWLGGCVWMGMTILAAFKNGTDAHQGEIDEVGLHARTIVENLEGRPWLVTHGVLDDNILLAAYDTRRKVVALDLSKGQNPIYLRYIAQMFSEPRLRNLATAGIMPLVQGWLKYDEQVTKKLAMLIMPDLWSSAGFTTVPNCTVFLGAKQADRPDPNVLLVKHRQFWEKLRFKPATGEGEHAVLLRAFASESRRQLSMVANNLGVVLEDLGDENGALEAYSRARELNPANLSALYNLSLLLEKKGAGDQLENVRKGLAALEQEKGRWDEIWSLVQYDGYVRHPEAFVQIGSTWEVSGHAELAAWAFRRALMLSPEAAKPAIKVRLAGVLLRTNRRTEAEETYLDVLRNNPTRMEALLGLAHLNTLKSDFRTARELLGRAETVAGDSPDFWFERALLEEREGNLREARGLLEKVIQTHPDHRGALLALASLLVKEGSERPVFEGVLEKIEALDQGTVLALLLRAEQAFQRKDLKGCRKLLEEAIRLAKSPNPRIIEMLARIDYMEGKYESAEQHALRLVQLDPDSTAGNYIRGHLQARRGELDLAEDSLRHSLETAETPEAWNDLAWVLQEKGKGQEAEECAKRALKLDDKRYQTWDTLGVILMKLGRLSEAEQALDQSLRLFDGDPTVLLHMVELRIDQRDGKRAREILRTLVEKEASLSETDRRKLAELRQNAEKL